MNIYHRIKNAIKRRIDEWHDLKLIRDSGFFDRNWYLAKNYDVAKSKMDPLLHYLQEGGFQGCDPGPLFCSRWYLSNYEDVQKSGLNPLIHYLKLGQKLGYQPQSVVMNFVNAAYCATCDAWISNYYPYHSEKTKIFCVGHNKTGTTSIQAVLADFGFAVGFQGESEILMADWVVRDFRRIIKFCETADAFQDVPFSLDYTYQVVDNAFHGSKFILTVRNNADEWYESLLRFYSRIMNTDSIVTLQEIKNYNGGNDIGWLWRFQQHVYGATEKTLFDKNLYKAYYEKHNSQIMEYFKYRPNDLLVLNLSAPDVMKRLCDFLGIKFTGQVMPHLNKSQD